MAFGALCVEDSRQSSGRQKEQLSEFSAEAQQWSRLGQLLLLLHGSVTQVLSGSLLSSPHTKWLSGQTTATSERESERESVDQRTTQRNPLAELDTWGNIIVAQMTQLMSMLSSGCSCYCTYLLLLSLSSKGCANKRVQTQLYGLLLVIRHKKSYTGRQRKRERAIFCCSEKCQTKLICARQLSRMTVAVTNALLRGALSRHTHNTHRHTDKRQS